MLRCVRITAKHFRGRSVIAGEQGDADHTLQFLCGACESVCLEISGLWSGRAHASLLFWMAGVIVIVFALRFGDGKTVSPHRRQPKSRGGRSCSVLHISPSCLVFTRSSWRPLTPALRYSTSSLIVFPSNCVSQSLRYACNRPPLSWYHACQVIA
jgi:hypothetical protein